MVLGEAVMSPRYLVRIDEIWENPSRITKDMRTQPHPTADWVPILGAIESKSGGVTGTWWYCDGNEIEDAAINQPPPNAQPFQTFSTFFCRGFGFWLYRGDATRPNITTTFHPLRFEHDRADGYSSYLTEAASNSALLCRRTDQSWIKMLLPDIYHGDYEMTSQNYQYGALKGDLGVFLGLIAFSVRARELQGVFPAMFRDGRWQTYTMNHGRTHKRGVVVYIYTCPKDWPEEGQQASTSNELRNYEQGRLGKYYY